MQALQNFFAALVYSANTSFDSLLESLLACAKPSPQSGGIAKQALHSIAQCVAVLCLAAGDQKCTSTVKMLTDILKDDSSPNSVSSLLCICPVVIFFLIVHQRIIQGLHAPIQSDLKAYNCWTAICFSHYFFRFTPLFFPMTCFLFLYLQSLI